MPSAYALLSAWPDLIAVAIRHAANALLIAWPDSIAVAFRHSAGRAHQRLHPAAMAMEGSGLFSVWPPSYRGALGSEVKAS